MGSFPRTARLLVATDFKRAFERRPAQRGRLFTIHQIPRTEPAGPEEATDKTNGARLGIVVPKKILRSAVHRNLVKRIVREAFRARAVRLAPTDVVVRLTGKPRAPDGIRTLLIDRRALATEIGMLLDRLPTKPSLG